MLSAQDILMALQIAVAAIVIIVLYHLLFIVVDLRKILKRFDHVSERIETVVMKPLSMADTLLEWGVSMIEEHNREKKMERKEKKQSKKK